MMKTIKFLSFILIILLNFSCRKDNLDASNLKFNGSHKGNPAIDAWLKENYLDPYNIEVLYKWDASEISTNNTLVPPDEKFVIPVMEMVKKSWIDVYNAMGNPNFIKEHSPKQYLLVGSPEYNSSGGLTVGFAEGGTKIALFRINWFDLGNRTLIKRILKTIHHEYIHILNQKKRFQDEFGVVSAGDYTSTFAQLNDEKARELGFITPYAGSSAGEDFAEMVSVILTEGRERYEEILASIQNQTAVNKLKAKEAIIVDYYKTYWNIDFYALTAKTEASLNEISPIDLNLFIGIRYNNISFDVRSMSLLGPQAQQAFKDMQLAFKNHTSGAATGRNIDYLNMVFTPGNNTSVELQFRYSVRHGAATATGKVYLKMSFDVGTNKVKFSSPTPGTNAAFVMDQLAPLFNYLTSKTFKFKFKEGYNKNTIGDNFGGLVEENKPLEFVYGTLTEPTALRAIGITDKNINLHINDNRFWSGAALTAIQNVKTAYRPTGATADSKVDVIRFEFGITDAKMKAKASQAPEWKAYTNLDYNFDINFDPFEKTLTFSNYAPVNQSAINHKSFADKFSDYLTSRTFKVALHTQAGLGEPGDRFLKITNVADESDFFITQLNAIPLHIEMVRSVRYFNLFKQNYAYYYGALKTIIDNTKPVIAGVEHTFNHMLVYLPDEQNARMSLYFRPPGGTPLKYAIVDLNMDFDREKNEFRFTPKATSGDATIRAELGDFINYFTSRTFKVVYATGNYYSTSGAEGHLIDTSNPANYIVLSL